MSPKKLCSLNMKDPYRQEKSIESAEKTYLTIETETPDTVNVERPMGLGGASSFIFGSIIGTGIFISINETFNVFSTNNILFVASLWVLGGLISLLGSLCYAELGCRFPITGGDCVYYSHALGKKFSVLFVIMFVFVVKTITLAAMALTGAKYLINSFEQFDESSTRANTIKIAFAFLLIAFLANCLNKGYVTKFIYAFAMLKLVAVLVIIGFGIYFLCTGNNADWKGPYVFKGFDFSRLSTAFIMICWSYEGWNSIGLKAGDIRNPSKNILLASIIGVFSATLVYTLTVLSYSAVLGFNVVRISETVALSFAVKSMKIFYPFITVAICLSALGSMISCLYALGGVTTFAGLEQILPFWFSLVTTNSRVPIISIFLITLISCAFVLVEFQILLNYCSFITWVFYFLSFTCLLLFKFGKGHPLPTGNIFTIHFSFVILMQLICIYVVIMCFFNYLYGCLTISSFIVVIFILQYIPIDSTNSISVQKFKNQILKKMKVWFDLEPAVQSDIQ